jgi:hypothetical protein
MSGIIGVRESRGSGTIRGLRIGDSSVIDDPIVTQGSDATGDVYYRAASGKLTRLATGADGTVLTSTGVGAVPAFESAPGGMVLLQTVTASDDLTILIGSEVLFSNTYRAYKITGSNIKVSSDDTIIDVYVKIGTDIMDGGSGASENKYYWNRRRVTCADPDADADTSGEAGDKFERLLGNGIGNAAGERISFEMTVYDPDAGDMFTTLSFNATHAVSDGHLSYAHGNGDYRDVAACTGIQFKCTVGSLYSGYFKLYGMT